MCGICGQIRFDGVPADEKSVLRMRDSLRHRGPDDEGLWSETFSGGGIVLGHTRLSIIDLSSAGHQPMCDSSKRYWIVFNGEVYNYREIRAELEKSGSVFHTQTDTEVILAAYARWGQTCLDRFIGMFAIAIWDSREKQLFCARDRLGIKPFYYSLHGNVLSFASEIKALLKADIVQAQPNGAMVYDYLSFCLIDHCQETFFNNIKQLAPGSFAVFDCKKFSVQRYWELRPGATRECNNAVEQFRELFDDSIRLRLRSDVPVGVLLSGGLDSSAIAATAASLLSPDKPRTFSSSLAGIGLDESAYATSVATYLNADNTMLFPQGNAFWEELDDMLYAQDEPVHASDIYANWCMMREVAKKGIKVLLNGQGGDELFGGYGWYVKNVLSSYLLQGNMTGFFSELRALHSGFSVTMTKSYTALLANVAEALLWPGIKRLYKQELAGMRAISRRTFLHDHRNRDTKNISIVNASTFEEKTCNDIVYFNVPHYLHYEDRNSMHFSIEERVPFLDHRLVEWASRLPVAWKVRAGTTKYVVRKAFEGRLPQNVLYRKDKMGLSIPIETWIRGELAGKFLRFFEEDCYIYNAWIDKQALLKHFNSYMHGNRTIIDRLLWRLFSLEKWCRLFLS